MTAGHQHQQLDEPVTILLVEDNPGDIRLIEEAFEMTDTDTRLHSTTNGESAVDLLTQKATAESESLPDLVLVDLNLPRRDGCDVLEAIRDDSQLRPLPVIMLTSSQAREDVRRCYEAHANAYLSKPTNPDEFISVAQAVDQFWFEYAQLPPLSQ